MMSTLIPLLFDKRFFNGSDYSRLQLIHSHGFKNGFGVDLEDDAFNRDYKKYTKYDHISVTINRKWIETHTTTNFDEFIAINISDEKEGDTYDDEEEEKEILMTKIETTKSVEMATEISCDENTGFKNCKYINYLITMLKSHQHSNESIKYEHLQQLSSAYDHLIRSHKLFLNVDRKNEIEAYFIKHIGHHCIYQDGCKILVKHINTKRENIDNHGGIDSLFHFLKINDMNDADCMRLFSWIEENEYDSDSIRGDVDDIKDSNMYQDDIINNTEYIELIKQHMSIKQHIFGDDIAAKQVFNSIHVYMMHSGQQLCRLKNALIETKMRFSTNVDNLNDSDINNYQIQSINFGCNVLKWLQGQQQSTYKDLKDCIINNPLSTVDVETYAQYEEKCKVLCQLNYSLDIIMDEMISMKLYTDTTKYQSALRRAFWNRNTEKAQQEKRNFYQWAITLYKCFLRYSGLPPRFDDESTKPIKLYHGLNAVFAFESTVPVYNGIFSVSTEQSVAQSFSECKGTIWTIQGSYNNPFKLMVGIRTDWFSSFKNEGEFIVFNGVIPIKSVITFASAEDEKIDILVKQLLVSKHRIIDKKLFLKSLGFRIEQHWTNKLLTHHQLFERTALKCTVFDRLISELQVWGQSQVVCDSWIVNKSISIKPWDPQTNTGGVLQIHCTKSLIISDGACIEAKGYKYGYGSKRNRKDKALTTMYMGTSDSFLDLGTGGGIIELIAHEVINKGIIKCSGGDDSEGGTIKVCAQSFKNAGQITAGMDGGIAIFAEEFINEGTIKPSPYICDEKEYIHANYIADFMFTPIAHSKLDETPMPNGLCATTCCGNIGDIACRRCGKYFCGIHRKKRGRFHCCGAKNTYCDNCEHDMQGRIICLIVLVVVLVVLFTVFGGSCIKSKCYES